MTKTQHLIFGYVWKRGKTSRREIGEFFGINPSTVTRNLKPLMDAGLIEVIGYVPTNGVGRKSEVIAVNEKWGKFLGISLEHGGVEALLLDLKGNVLKEFEKRVVVGSANFRSILEDIARELEGEEFRAVAIAVPGIVEDGKVVYSQALGLVNFDLASSAEGVFGRRVFVINDANAAAADFSDETDNLVCFLLTIPYDLSEAVGLGAGIWLNGRLYTGVHGAAGETGPGVRIVEGGGTLDDLISGRLKPSDRFVKLLSERMGILSQFMDPEIVVLSGDFSVLPDETVREIIKGVRSFFLREIEVRVDESGGRAVARGAFMALMNSMLFDLETMEEYLEGAIP